MNKIKIFTIIFILFLQAGVMVNAAFINDDPLNCVGLPGIPIDPSCLGTLNENANVDTVYTNYEDNDNNTNANVIQPKNDKNPTEVVTIDVGIDSENIFAPLFQKIGNSQLGKKKTPADLGKFREIIKNFNIHTHPSMAALKKDLNKYFDYVDKEHQKNNIKQLYVNIALNSAEFEYRIKKASILSACYNNNNEVPNELTVILDKVILHKKKKYSQNYLWNIFCSFHTDNKNSGNADGNVKVPDIAGNPNWNKLEEYYDSLNSDISEILINRVKDFLLGYNWTGDEFEKTKITYTITLSYSFLSTIPLTDETTYTGIDEEGNEYIVNQFFFVKKMMANYYIFARSEGALDTNDAEYKKLFTVLTIANAYNSMKFKYTNNQWVYMNPNNTVF